MRYHAIKKLADLFLFLGFVLAASRNPRKRNSAPDVIKQADAAFREGFAARQAGNLELARNKFAEVVLLQPQIAEGHEALGAVLVEMGKPLEGAKEFEAASVIKPADDAIETTLALAYFQGGDPVKAIPHFDAAISLSQQPGHAAVAASFYDAYGRVLAGTGKPEQAALQFVAEEAITGPRADLEDAIGTLEAQQQNWHDAQQRFDHAISLDASYVKARIHLGLLQRAQKDIEGALNTLAAASALDPRSAEALMEYGRTLAAAGKDDEAVLQFNAAIKTDATLPGIQLDLAMALQRLGRQQEAVPLVSAGTRARPPQSFGAHQSRIGADAHRDGKGGTRLLQTRTR